MADDFNDRVESEALADLFEKVRDRRMTGSRSPYQTDDVLAVFTLLARGNSPADITRATFIDTAIIRKWRDALLNGTIHMLYPDIAERANNFDRSSVPHVRMALSRQRLRHTWQQRQMLLEEGRNPYARPNGHMTVPTGDSVS